MPPSFRTGKNGYFTLSSATGGVINYSSGISSVSYERNADALNVTTYGDSDDVMIAGLRGGSISVSGLFAPRKPLFCQDNWVVLGYYNGVFKMGRKTIIFC